MRLLRMGLAYLAAVIVTYALASAFYTQQVLAKQAAIGAVYTQQQQISTYMDNFAGLAMTYGLMLAIGLLIAFLIAAVAKRILKPLAPIAYPIAGAAAVFTVIWAIENLVAPGGVGAIGGARDALGVSLQCLAGAAGGLVFALTRGTSR
ncbi:MAG: hypothetical protein GXP04_04505 [Alphaproteobacteria bacterium]|nr:hypothetical protein [Alphaproteobacteria bacterium]